MEKNQSETIGAIATALCAAQAELKSAEKDGKNPHFKSHYATVESVLDACLPVLNKHGIALIQRPCPCADGVELETMFVHSSGEWVSGRIHIPLSKNDAHGVGSAITYSRRYSLAAMAGLKQGDDDGTAAVEAANPLAKLPADIVKGFEKLRAAKKLSEADYLKGVDSVMKANQGDIEAVRAYLTEKGAM